MGHRYVAVEGVIGVGKTTLVRRLAQRLEGRTVLEEFEENPFLPRFYADRHAYALSTQLFFLMSRFKQQEQLAQGDLFHEQTISDYVFDKDRIFAVLTLAQHELAVYEQLFGVLRPQVVTPDLVIYLRADHDIVMGRIKERGRDYELDMDPDYIRDLGRAYAAFFKHYDLCPVLTIDTSHLDFRSDEEALDEVVDIVTRGASPRGLAGRSNMRQPTLV